MVDGLGDWKGEKGKVDGRRKVGQDRVDVGDEKIKLKEIEGMGRIDEGNGEEGRGEEG